MAFSRDAYRNLGWLLLVILPLALTMGACFAPEYGDSAFQCSSTGECPSGYECREDGVCYRNGVTGGDLPLAGDICAEAVALSEGVRLSGSIDRATSAADFACGDVARPELFFFFTLTNKRSISLTLGSVFETSLVLLGNDCVQEFACAKDMAVGEVLALDSLAAGTYFVAVEAAAGAVGDFTLELTTDEPIVRPPNDTCDQAIQLAAGTVRVGDALTLALNDVSASCGAEAIPDVAYSFTVPSGSNKRAIVTVSNAIGFDPVLSLGGPDCDGEELRCSQERTDGAETIDATDLAPGVYIVWVGGDVAAQGTFDIGLELLPAVGNPGNDTCATAEILVEDVPFISSTTGATDSLDLMCVASDSRDTVHEFTIDVASAVLVSLEPLTNWGLSASLRDSTTCEISTDLSCVRSAEEVRYINQPNLAAGTYSVVVDGIDGQHGDYSIVYETAPVDLTFGYRATTSIEQFVPLGAQATSHTVTMANNDEETFNESLPFSFGFFGTPKTSVNINTNGFLSFDVIPGGIVESNFHNDCDLDATTPFNMIAVFWDDHLGNINDDQTLKHQVLGDAPNRKFVVEWSAWDLLDTSTCNPDFSLCDAVSARVTHQAILHENGDIEFHYGPRTAAITPRTCLTPELGCSATIGLRDSAGTDFDLYGCDFATLVASNTVIRFIPPR